ncbi:MAG: hypothetical protein M3Y05_16560 [Gemmatimonadota bacterium]|nr:hypothetical protein [Gemmatimonadota bacterium]
MSTPLGPILSMWEAEGNRHAAALDACAGAVVIGERPSTAAEVALGIARVQARRRRVAVADTVGELGPLEDLVPMDAPYGLIDSFFYGVSLNKIAYTVDPAKNLIIFPSGAPPIDHEALLGSDRWVKLLDGFRAADGLLLIVAPAESSALSSLIQVMDGVVLVGNVAAAPGTRVLAHARLPVIPARPTPPSEAAISSTPSMRAPTSFPTPVRPSAPVSAAAPAAPPASPPQPPAPPAPLAEPPVPPRPSFHDWSAIQAIPEGPENDVADTDDIDDEQEQVANPSRGSRGLSAEVEELPPHERVDEHVERTPNPELVPPWAREEEFTGPSAPRPGNGKAVSFWVAIIFGAFIAAALLTWLTTSMLSRNDGADSFAAKPDSAHPAAHVIAAPAPTALAAPVPSPSTNPTSIPHVSALASAAASTDSASSPYSVVLADVSTLTGANGELEQASARSFPVVTFAPYPRADGQLSYVVIAGAFPDSVGADSLLRAVREKRYRNANAAHIVKLPYAVLVQKGVSQDQASMFVRAYLSKGLPVYPLLQPDGSATLFAGAFRTVEQAQPLVTSFKANGDQPTVTIRTGRSF